MKQTEALEYSNAVDTVTETKIAAYQLTDYLERLGVEVIFGLCGHTIIGFLDALGKSRIRYISTRHEQIAAHAADGLCPGIRQAGCSAHSSRTRPHKRHYRRCECCARFHPDGRGLRRYSVALLRPPSPSGGQSAYRCRSIRRSIARSAKRVYRVDRVQDFPRIVERAFHLAVSGRPGPVLVDVQADMFQCRRQRPSMPIFLSVRSLRFLLRFQNRRSIPRWRSKLQRHCRKRNVRCSMPAAAFSHRVRQPNCRLSAGNSRNSRRSYADG